MRKTLPTLHVLRNTAREEFTQQFALERNATHTTDPFAVTNVSEILGQVKKWKEWFGFITPYYALKAQHNILTKSLFHRLGVGYDCASYNEIRSVLGTGCTPNSYCNASFQESLLYRRVVRPGAANCGGFSVRGR
eukprot:sb/3474719/